MAGQAEEPVLLGHAVQPGEVLGAAAVDSLVGGVEALAPHAVVTLVGPPVQVAGLGAAPPQPLDRRCVARVGARAHEVVEGDVERRGEGGEARRMLGDVLGRRHPRSVGGEHVLEGVVVGASEEADLVAGGPAGAGETSAATSS